MTDVAPCDRCDQPHLDSNGRPTCTGHVKTDRDSYVPGQDRVPLEQPRPCKKPRPRGAGPDWVCQMHGGAASQVKAKREREQTERDAAAVLHAFGAPVDVDPAEELLDLICATAGYVRFLRSRVGELEQKRMIWGRTKRKVGGDDHGTTHETKPNIWIQMLADWSDRHAKLVVEALKLNLDERRVRLAERQGEAIVRVLDGVLAELGHDPADPQTAQVVARHLHAVDNPAV